MAQQSGGLASYMNEKVPRPRWEVYEMRFLPFLCILDGCNCDFFYESVRYGSLSVLGRDRLALLVRALRSRADPVSPGWLHK